MKSFHDSSLLRGLLAVQLSTSHSASDWVFFLVAGCDHVLSYCLEGHDGSCSVHSLGPFFRKKVLAVLLLLSAFS